MNTYSQQGEDLVIAELVKGTPNGRVLEIGAWDPITFSNSRLLIEQGWSAVLVEPSPVPVRKLITEYGMHPNVIVLAAAITPDPVPYIQMRISDDGVSSNDTEHLRKWEAAAKYIGYLCAPCFTPGRLAQMFGHFDVISIDAEGCSVPIAIEAMRHFQPLVWCIEHDGRVVEICGKAQQHGYRMETVNNTNVILVKR